MNNKATRPIRWRRGITMVELVIAVVCSVVVIIAIGTVLADSHRGWRMMYGKVHADIVEDGYVARMRFDSVMREASGSPVSVAEDGSWIEVCYYSNSEASSPDMYARFFVSDNDLMLENGVLEPRATSSVHTICGNVSACTFKYLGKSAQMKLTLSDGAESNNVVTSAYMHN